MGITSFKTAKVTFSLI